MGHKGLDVNIIILCMHKFYVVQAPSHKHLSLTAKSLFKKKHKQSFQASKLPRSHHSIHWQLDASPSTFFIITPLRLTLSYDLSASSCPWSPSGWLPPEQTCACPLHPSNFTSIADNSSAGSPIHCPLRRCRLRILSSGFYSSQSKNRTARQAE